MSIVTTTKSSLNHEIKKVARTNVIQKLTQMGIDYNNITEIEFDAMVSAEAEGLKNDTKKVGLGIGIGLVISLLTGF